MRLPPLENDDYRHQKKKGKKKRFIIEYKRDESNKSLVGSLFRFFNEWTIYKRYATKEDRDKALADCEKKNKLKHYIHRCFMYRAVDE